MDIKTKIDGANISESLTHIIDKWRYRKYADNNYVSVIWINKENTAVKLIDGKLDGDILHIPSQQNAEKMINKVYILSTKRTVTKLCFVKEDINSTLDILVIDVTKLNAVLFKSFVNVKLMEDFQGFNIGQVMLGGSIGLVVGFVLCLGAFILM